MGKFTNKYLFSGSESNVLVQFGNLELKICVYETGMFCLNANNLLVISDDDLLEFCVAV